MRLLPFMACLFLTGCSAAPPGDHEYIVVKDNFFDKDYVIYTGEYDIVKIYVPFNQFNFDDNAIDQSSSSSSEEIEHPYTLFFIEGDIKEDNEKMTNHGLYVLKGGKATKLLDNGKDVIATQTNTIYFGAKDGIYKYDNVTNTASKYGTVTDCIKQLAHNNKTDSIYYLSDSHEIYKLNEDATASVKVAGIKDVQEMVFGFEGKLYYYDSDKVFYVVDIEAGGVPKKIEGLPANINKIMLVSPMYGMEEGAILLVDEQVYALQADEAEITRVKIQVPITAAAPQATLIQFYAKDKKIYEFNILVIMLSDLFEGMREALNQYQDVISSVKKASF